MQKRIGDGFLYGDFQFAIDSKSDDFCRKGILSCYVPVASETPISHPKKLSTRSWMDLVYAAHVQPTRAFEEYARYYQSTSGNVYWADLAQFSNYKDGFHEELDGRLKGAERGSEVITEIYVPRTALPEFMAEVRKSLRKDRAALIYGTVRLIEKDDESFLAWAREPFACIIFNLHVVHSAEGLKRAQAAFRGLIDLAIHFRGSYYLTYHKFATRKQLETCYPQFDRFLNFKLRYDPEERFQSNWYRHYKANAAAS